MSSPAYVLLNAIVQQGLPAYRALMRRGFSEAWLRERNLIEIWRTIDRHIKEHRQVPTSLYLQTRHPHYYPLKAQEVEKENAVALASLLKESYISSQLEDLLEQSRLAMLSDPQGALSWMAQQIQRINKVGAGEDLISITSAQSCSDIQDEMEGNAPPVLTIPYAWPSLQEETLGMAEKELVLLYGRPKSMKSFLALHLVCHAFMQSSARVLVVSREMPKEQCRKRIIAMLAGLPYGPWRRNQLTRLQREEVRSLLSYLVQLDNDNNDYSRSQSGKQPCLVVADSLSMRGSKGLDKLHALIDLIQPDIVLDDSIYLAAEEMDMGGGGKAGGKTDGMDWKAQAALIRSAKQLAQTCGIAYLATTQAGRASRAATPKRTKGESEDQYMMRREEEKAIALLDELTDAEKMAFSDAYAQNCDLAIRTVLLEEQNMILLGFPAYREGKLGLLPIHALPCVNFGEITSGDLYQKNLSSHYLNAMYVRDNAASTLPAGSWREGIEQRESFDGALEGMDA